MSLRDHEPVTIDKFNGLYDRGDIESTPLDHFSDCNNLKFAGPSGFSTRNGIGLHQNVAAPLGQILRMYNYSTDQGNTLLVLTAGGSIYHVISSTVVYGPILTIGAMTDFAFIQMNGRAFISPFSTEVRGDLNIERGLQNESIYVYKGDGSNARKAAGAAPSGTITIANGAAGNTDAGTHVFAVVGETDTGYLSKPVAFASFVTSANLSVNFSTIPTFVGSQWVKRHIVASKVIQNYAGNLQGYDMFFIPNADINNNVATTLSNISFFDSDLLKDATHLSDNFDTIPAGCALCTYHDRLVSMGEYDNISVARVSAVGEPEAVSQIDGLISVPIDGNPLTNGAELRDVLYLTKRNKTVAYVDNGDTPTNWPYSGVDSAMGCGVHGIGTVVDTGSSNIDYLLITTYKGVALFNGRYILPELSYKIQNRWIQQDFKQSFRHVQILNDSVNSLAYIITTDRKMIFADYKNGFDPKSIRWSPWSFDVLVNTIALINVSELLLGCDQV